MPIDFAVHATGHDLRSVSAIYEYLDPSVALAMPGAIVLAGWPALPWGQLGVGPVPPSLQELISSGLVSDMQGLDDVIDHLYKLDSESPPQIMRRGHLRPLMHAAFASQIMYNDERALASEMHNVRVGMRESLTACKMASSSAEAASLISSWGVHLKTAFDSANLHLTAPTVSNNSMPVSTIDDVLIIYICLAVGVIFLVECAQVTPKLPLVHLLPVGASRTCLRIHLSHMMMMHFKVGHENY